MQLNLFREALLSIEKAGVEPGIVHAANSGALAFHEDSYFDMIRPGIFLYGYSPAANDVLPAEPLMELRSKVVLVKKAEKGEAISYGRTWTAQKETFIGVIPAGYADGLNRLLSNNHSVLIRNKTYPLVGRICMDHFMVNLGSDSDVKRWDDATIFGPGFVTAAGLAEKLSTIPYEITCGITKRVIREYVN
jgi:alanine racemase